MFPIGIGTGNLDPLTAEAQKALVAVDRWQNAIAAVWTSTMAAAPRARRVTLLIWGDPSFYVRSLRSAARLRPAPQLHVVPGKTAPQVLTAAAGIAINTLGRAFPVTPSHRLSQNGWPKGVASLAVMLGQGVHFKCWTGLPITSGGGPLWG